MRTVKGYIAYMFKILLVTSIVFVSLGTTIVNANIGISPDIETVIGASTLDGDEPDEVDGVAPAHVDDSVNSPPSQTETLTEHHIIFGEPGDLGGNIAEKLSFPVLTDGDKKLPLGSNHQGPPPNNHLELNKVYDQRNDNLESTNAWTTIMSDNFEGAFPGSWSVFDKDGGTNGEYYWDDDDYKPYAGSWSAWPANGGADGVDPESYYYANDMDAWMVYGPFDLSDANDAHLQFWYWNQSEEHYDYFGWTASTNGTNFDGYEVSGDSVGWNWVDFDLTSVPWSGDLTGNHSVWIAFSFTSDYSNVDDGPFVDNVLLEKNTLPPRPNLTPITPHGADYPIVPSSVTDTMTVNDLYFNQDTYIDWSVINDGAVNITDTFYTCLYFDGSERNCWYINGLDVDWIAWVADWILDLTPTLGWHNLEIVADVYNDIAESNESDNSWNADFYWDEFRDCDAVTAAFAEKYIVQSVNNPVTTNPSFMPPHPDLWERYQRGEVDLPRFITDSGAAIESGINQPGELEAGPSGTWRAVAILVEFTDNESQVGASNFDTLLFNTGTGTMRDYFNDVSYGTLDIVTVNLPSSLGWCLMPETYAYYTDGQFGTDGAYPNNAQKLAENAVAVADPYIDFSQYDNDSDGWVDTVFVVHAGSGAEITGSGNDIWSHSWETVNDPVVDGVTVNSYTTEPEFWNTPGDMTMGVYAHELGHVFGLPDLYDTDDSSSGVGRWSLMGSGSWNGTNGDSPAWLDAWSRAELEFLTPVNVTSNRIGESIPAAESDQTVYRLWTNGTGGSEYFLVENRQSIGYDSELPAHGLLIWHIDENKTTNTAECSQNNNWLCGSNHFLVAIEQADGLWELENKTDSGDTGDLFPGSTTNRTFNAASVPNSSSYYGSGDTLVQVINISNSGSPMTADLFVSEPIEPAEANFDGTPRSGIAPLYVDFTNLSTGGYDTCSWDFGATGSATGCGNPSHQFPNPGNFYVALTVSGPGGEDTETKTDYITVYDPVAADFSGSPTNGVAPLEVAFTNLSTGDYDTCTWNFGDGNYSYSCGDPSHPYTSDGTYTVSLEVSGPGGLNTEIKTGYIDVAAGVHAEFSGAPTSGTAPLTVDFLNLSTGDYNTCSWNFGDGGSSSSCGNPSYTYNDPGAYGVSLTVSGPGGEETEAKVNYVEAYAAVEANFSGTPTSGIGSLVVDFSNWSSGDYDTCLWNFGDGSTSPSCGNPSHTYTTDGVYTVSLQVSGRGGSDTDSKVDYITVYEPVMADFSGTPTNGVAPLDVDFTNLSTGDYDTCSWNFGDGGSSTTCGNPSHTYNSDGLYTVSLTVNGPGGSDTETKSGYVTVSDQVVANFSASPTSGVAPLGVDFTNLSTGDYNTCSWDFGDGGSSSTCGDWSHTYNTDGVYTVSLTVSGPGGSDAETKTGYIAVYEAVAADFSASPTGGVAPLDVDFTNLSSGDYNTCSWNFGDGGLSSSCANPSHTYTSDGTYNVSLTVSGPGGSDTETKSSYITVSDAVSANFSGSPRSGIGSLDVDLTNLSSGDYDTCLWDYGDGNQSSSCGNPSHTYTTDGVFTVSLEISGSGGSDTEIKHGYITVYEPASANFSASQTHSAASMAVDFTNLSSGDYDTCSWEFGDGGSSASCGNQTHTYTNPGVYTVSLMVSGDGGTDTETKTDYIVVVSEHKNYIPLIIKA